MFRRNILRFANIVGKWNGLAGMLARKQHATRGCSSPALSRIVRFQTQTALPRDGTTTRAAYMNADAISFKCRRMAVGRRSLKTDWRKGAEPQ